MTIQKLATAGTLESSDALVTLEPADTVEITLQSTVIEVFEQDILKCIRDTLANLGVTGAKVSVQDKGAFDCTLAARLEAAVYRATEGGEAQ